MHVPRPRSWTRTRTLLVGAGTALLIAGSAVAVPPAQAATTTTAWQNGSFHVDTANLVRRSDLVLKAVNGSAGQFVPLGNGTLGVAAWAANGFTAQLNRADTFPDRKSPGQVVIPGLGALTGTVNAAHLDSWHTYWAGSALIKISSSDGSGDYVENLRTLYLYDAAAEGKGSLPASQAGVADLFTFSQDHQDWFPSGYWFWNLRMQMQANLTAGQFTLDDPIFALYRTNIAGIQSWTSSHVPGKTGLCVPSCCRPRPPAATGCCTRPPTRTRPSGTSPTRSPTSSRCRRCSRRRSRPRRPSGRTATW
jgi:hypothetical protein